MALKASARRHGTARDLPLDVPSKGFGSYTATLSFSAVWRSLGPTMYGEIAQIEEMIRTRIDPGGH
jgi:hypothetical protein